jgi:hypothetical protein
MPRKVFVIAGHEGKGTGASSQWLDEGSETLALQELILYALKNKYDIEGVKDIPKYSLINVLGWLEEQAVEGDIILDLHFNAYSNPKAGGTEVLYPTVNTNVEIKMANKLQRLVVDLLKTRNRGTYNESRSPHNRLGMLRGPYKAVNLLLEVCFCTNKDDVDKYVANRIFLADAIAKFLSDYANEK